MQQASFSHPTETNDHALQESNISFDYSEFLETQAHETKLETQQPFHSRNTDTHCDTCDPSSSSNTVVAQGSSNSSRISVPSQTSLHQICPQQLHFQHSNQEASLTLPSDSNDVLTTEAAPYSSLTIENCISTQGQHNNEQSQSLQTKSQTSVSQNEYKKDESQKLSSSTKDKLEETLVPFQTHMSPPHKPSLELIVIEDDPIENCNHNNSKYNTKMDKKRKEEMVVKVKKKKDLTMTSNKTCKVDIDNKR
jgi:hypothetical protein